MKFGITGNISNKKKFESVRNILHQLDEMNVSYVVEKGFANALRLDDSGAKIADLGSESDMVLAFGGDGTLLNVAKKIGAKGVPILGINAGHLGFLAELQPEEFSEHISSLLNGKYETEKRIILEAEVTGSMKSEFLAVNDIVVDKGGSPRLISISLTINYEFCHIYSCDGIIISTATGSTAYSLSAGGPIVYPTIDNIIVTPICPHTLSARPMIVPGNFEIELEVVSGPEEIPVHADGHPCTNIKSGDKVIIRKSDVVLNLVHLPGHSFFSVLRTKLGWGARNNAPPK